MYIKGIPDYDRQGKQRETGLFAGLVSQDGELRTTTSGKQYGSASVRAYNRKDGTAAFLAIKSFSESTAGAIAALRKGDRILAAGVVESREYNGKTYTDMMVDFLMIQGPLSPAENRAALERRVSEAFPAGSGGFAPIDGEDGELPF